MVIYRAQVETARQRYAELTGKVEAFFDRVRGKYASAIQCAAGCSDCCSVRLSVPQVEAEAIDEALAADPAWANALAERAATRPAERCAALGDDGACEIYHMRPLVCRSHGIPIRARRPDNRVRLTVVDACFKNFRGDVALDDVHADDILDQETLSTVVAGIELAYCRERKIEPGARMDLAALVLKRR